MSLTPRWGPLPWFVFVLTLLVVLFVVLLPPLVLDEEPSPWVLRAAARLASWHGDPDPIEAEWMETTRAEAARIMEATAGADEPSPSPSATDADTNADGVTASPSATASATPVEDPGRAVQLVVMRGRFDSAQPGGPPPPDAPENWLVVAFDSVTRKRWRVAVLTESPVLPEEARTFEF